MADAGSCHLGKRAYAEKLIDVGKECGVDVVKFQLFGKAYTEGGNIELPHELFKDLYNYGKTIGMPVTASVFDEKALELLIVMDVHHIKLGYSKRKQYGWIDGALNIGKKVVVTTNIHDAFDLPKHENLIKLITQPRCKHADEYAIVTKMHFEGLFDSRFEGFSDHSLGYMESSLAVSHGATWIEKHFRLDDEECDRVPDGRFALTPKQLKEYVWKVRP